MSLTFSIITVTRNNEATIGQTLESVATQSWSGIEHIVIDGASTDSTLAEVGRFAHVRRAISEPDSGIYDAMNKGLRHATGEVIAFLNADDHYTTPRVLESVAERFERSGVDAVLGDVEYFRAEAPDRPVRRYDSSRFAPSRLRWGWMPAHPGFFCLSDVYGRVGPFAIDYRIAADYEWMVRAFTRHHVRYLHIDEVLVRMRVGGISTAGIRSTILLNREMLRACRDSGLQTSLARLLVRYPLKLRERWGPRH